MKKRIWSVMLCLVLSLGLATPAALAAQQPVSPAPVIVVTPIRGGETLEVSVQTTAAAKAVHAVLSYDSSLLTPIQWDSGKTVIDIPEGTGWESSAAVHTLGYGGASGKPGLTYKTTGNNTAYLYLGAESIAEPLPGSTVAVTARFRYAAGADATQKALAASSVTFAAEAVAASSPANYVEAVIDADGKYYVDASAAPSAEYALLTRGEVQVQPEGPSQLPDGGTVSGGFAITFFDWDGRVADVAAVGPDATAQATAAQSKLSNKLGYAFDQWLFVKQTDTGLATEHGAFTSNNTPLNTADPDIANLKNVTQNLLVQAAYKAKTTENGFDSDLLNNGSSLNPDKFYTISEPTFNRYGTADANVGSYSLRFTVERKKDAYGVTRLREPAVVVIMTPTGANAQNILSLVKLDNTDSCAFEIVPTKQIAKVSYKVVDAYGVSNWPGCADKSDPNVSQAANTFIQEGTRSFLADQALAVKGGSEWDPTVNAQAFADCFVNTSDATRKNVSWWTEARCTQAKEKLVAATTGEKLSNEQVGTVLQNVT